MSEDSITVQSTDASPTDRPARVQVARANLSYGNVPVLADVSLDIFPEETVVLLGDSGCGKTTLLRVIAGLLKPDSGSVQVDGRDLFKLSKRDRRVVYLDQEALLFEHLNVFENVAFGLRLRKVAKSTIRKQVSEMLDAIGLSEHAEKRSWQLSGGQKQRIAFARAVLAEPRVLLLDEPFGSLDAKTRADMQQLFRQLASDFKITALFVTHDIREALVVGKRFLMMSAGQLNCYASREQFITDSKTGVQEEIEFWKRIQG